jgi:hypothetical protein
MFAPWEDVEEVFAWVQAQMRAVPVVFPTTDASAESAIAGCSYPAFALQLSPSDTLYSGLGLVRDGLLSNPLPEALALNNTHAQRAYQRQYDTLPALLHQGTAAGAKAGRKGLQQQQQQQQQQVSLQYTSSSASSSAGAGAGAVMSDEAESTPAGADTGAPFLVFSPSHAATAATAATAADAESMPQSPALPKLSSAARAARYCRGPGGAFMHLSLRAVGLAPAATLTLVLLAPPIAQPQQAGEGKAQVGVAQEVRPLFGVETLCAPAPASALFGPHGSAHDQTLLPTATDAAPAVGWLGGRAPRMLPASLAAALAAHAAGVSVASVRAGAGAGAGADAGDFVDAAAGRLLVTEASAAVLLRRSVLASARPIEPIDPPKPLNARKQAPAASPVAEAVRPAGAQAPAAPSADDIDDEELDRMAAQMLGRGKPKPAWMRK